MTIQSGTNLKQYFWIFKSLIHPYPLYICTTFIYVIRSLSNWYALCLPDRAWVSTVSLNSPMQSVPKKGIPQLLVYHKKADGYLKFTRFMSSPTNNQFRCKKSILIVWKCGKECLGIRHQLQVKLLLWFVRLKTIKCSWTANNKVQKQKITR